MTTDDLYGSGALIGLEARLIATFSPPLRPEQVQRCLFDAVARFGTVRIDTYLPVLIERAATRRLRLAIACNDNRVASPGISSTRSARKSSRRDRGDDRTSQWRRVVDEVFISPKTAATDMAVPLP